MSVPVSDQLNWPMPDPDLRQDALSILLASRAMSLPSRSGVCSGTQRYSKGLVESRDKKSIKSLGSSGRMGILGSEKLVVLCPSSTLRRRIEHQPENVRTGAQMDHISSLLGLVLWLEEARWALTWGARGVSFLVTLPQCHEKHGRSYVLIGALTCSIAWLEGGYPI